MISVMCPKCNTLTAMNISVTERTETDHEDNTVKIATTSYHCNNCHTFVRSEDKKIS